MVASGDERAAEEVCFGPPVVCFGPPVKKPPRRVPAACPLTRPSPSESVRVRPSPKSNAPTRDPDGRVSRGCQAGPRRWSNSRPDVATAARRAGRARRRRRGHRRPGGGRRRHEQSAGHMDHGSRGDERAAEAGTAEEARPFPHGPRLGSPRQRTRLGVVSGYDAHSTPSESRAESRVHARGSLGVCTPWGV
jgi:hypothetical protein